MLFDTDGISGDVADLGNLTSLVEINMSVTYTFGRIEDMVANQVKKGRSNGSILTKYPGLWSKDDKITFNCRSLATNFNVKPTATLSWVPNTDNTANIDITWGSYSETIDADGNIV